MRSISMAKRDLEAGPSVGLRLLAATDMGQVVGVHSTALPGCRSCWQAGPLNSYGCLAVLEAADAKQLEAAQLVARWGNLDRVNRAAECIAVSSRACLSDAGTALVAVGRVDGTTDILDACTGAAKGLVPAAAGNGGKRDRCSGVRGLSFLWGAAEAQAPRLLSCTANGAVQICAAERLTGSSDERGSGGAEPTFNWALMASWAVPKNVLCTSVDAAGRHLAVGAKGSELGVWDLHTQQRVFLGRASKPNRIGLVDPAHNTAVAYLPGPDGNTVLVGTGKHRLRLYDVRAHRRPALEVEFGSSRVTSLAVEACGLRAWAGDSSGAVELLDLRAAQLVGALKGLTGSVRALACHPELQVLAVVSLDRFLRIYNVQSRRLLGKVFLKQPPTGVAFCPPLPSAPVRLKATPEAATLATMSARKKRRRQEPWAHSTV